jgi:hypothetical protein
LQPASCRPGCAGKRHPCRIRASEFACGKLHLSGTAGQPWLQRHPCRRPSGATRRPCRFYCFEFCFAKLTDPLRLASCRPGCAGKRPVFAKIFELTIKSGSDKNYIF